MTAVVIALSMAATGVVGGVIGAAVASSGAASSVALAASTSPTPSSNGPGSGSSVPGGPGRTSNGKFVPNEDPTHEQGESAAREAQEDAGQVPTVP